MRLKAILQDLTIIIGLYLALRLLGLTMEWYHIVVISLGLLAFGWRNSFAAYRAGFSSGHDCGMSHKAPVHMEIKDQDEFDKVMAAIKKDFPVD